MKALWISLLCSSALAFDQRLSSRRQHVWTSQHDGDLLTHRYTLPPKRAYEGFPSKPGWETGRLDQLTDWVVNTKANRPIIREYRPDALWLWGKWTGTVLALVAVPTLLTMAIALSIVFIGDEYILDALVGVKPLWEYLLTLCTFILTFFTSQAYSHWRMVYSTTRAIQGRINDICMLLTISVERENDEYSERSKELLSKCTRLIRMSHTFFWAVTPTASNGLTDSNQFAINEEPCPIEDAIGPLLLSTDGLKGLVEVGELTEAEMAALEKSHLPPSQYGYILLEWVGLHITQGLKDGTIYCDGTNGISDNLLRQLTSLRAEYFNIDDYAAAKMPLAYVQLVQVLVDSLVFIAPFALYSDIGNLATPLTGLLTLFFKGLLELSKSFLDPFGFEGYPDQNIRVDVLVSELNFGASSRWVKAGALLPTDVHADEPVGISIQVPVRLEEEEESSE